MSAKHCAAAILFLLLAPLPAAADNTLAAARDLYAAAAYEEALTILNQLSEGTHGPDEERAIQQYRAFCLLALGRTADAEQAIAAVVAVQPRYQPGESDVSPRVRTTFAEVRRRVLPTVIQQQYAIAKSSYDRKNYAEAAERFNYVLDVMNDPEVRPVAAQPPLSDLRVLATGFRDLAVSAATPPPAPKPEPPPPRRRLRPNQSRQPSRPRRASTTPATATSCRPSPSGSSCRRFRPAPPYPNRLRGLSRW